MAEETGAATPGESEEDTSAGRFGRAKDYVNEQYSRASGKVRDGYNTVTRRSKTSTSAPSPIRCGATSAPTPARRCSSRSESDSSSG